MLIFPAIDLYGGQAVRLVRGDYAQMTVYSPDPAAVARDFKAQGAEWIHMVDLEGARDGATPNLGAVLAAKAASGLKIEAGGGIRTMETIRTYLEAGIDRVILGTAAVTDPSFAAEAAKAWPGRVAVGVDMRDGYPAVRGWTQAASIPAVRFCEQMQRAGIGTLIVTDISRDGMMGGTNRALYRELSASLSLRLIASGGVSSLADVRSLAAMGLYGAVIGKAYYTGAVDLKQAIAAAAVGKASEGAQK